MYSSAILELKILMILIISSGIFKTVIAIQWIYIGS